MKLKIKKLSENSVIPQYQTVGSAGFDLVVTSKDVLRSGVTRYHFGLAFEIPICYVGLIFPRSSVVNTSLSLSNSVGVIDCDYRGEVSAVFDRTRSGYLPDYEIGDRAAQMVIVPFVQCDIEETTELSETERGVDGYGSTGK